MLLRRLLAPRVDCCWGCVPKAPVPSVLPPSVLVPKVFVDEPNIGLADVDVVPKMLVLVAGAVLVLDEPNMGLVLLVFAVEPKRGFWVVVLVDVEPNRGFVLVVVVLVLGVVVDVPNSGFVPVDVPVPPKRGFVALNKFGLAC